MPAKLPLGPVKTLGRTVVTTALGTVRHPLRTAGQAVQTAGNAVQTAGNAVHTARTLIDVGHREPERPTTPADDAGGRSSTPTGSEQAPSATATKTSAPKTSAKKAPGQQGTAKTSPAKKATAKKAPAKGTPVPPPVPDPITAAEQAVQRELAAEPAAPPVATEPSAPVAKADADEALRDAAQVRAEEDREVTTPVGTTGADVGRNPDTTETGLQQPGTEPLMDPATTKAIKTEAERASRAADPEKG